MPQRIDIPVTALGFVDGDMIVLPLPEQGEGEVSVSDMFLKYFACRARADATLDDLSCKCKERTIVSQCRVLKWPNVLFVQVGRQLDGRADVSRQHVRAEVRLELPGLGAMELFAVVYHLGRSLTSGHYTCACRGTDRMFWYFDDLTRRDSGCRRLSDDVEQFLQRRVYLLVYARPQGASEFAGMGGVLCMGDVFVWVGLVADIGGVHCMCEMHCLG